MPLELSILDAEGNERLEVAELDALHHEIEIALPAEPAGLTLDPQLKLLARWQLEPR